MYIPWAFGAAGFIYAFPFVAGANYLASKYLGIGHFSWTFVISVSLVPAFILAIKILDW